MPGDPSLTDTALQDEIDLVEALVIAAARTDERLSQDEIDGILGVSAAGVGAPATTHTRSGR